MLDIDAGIIGGDVYGCVEDVLYEEGYLIGIVNRKSYVCINKMQELGLAERKDFVYVVDLNARKQVIDINLGYAYIMNSEYPGINVYGDDKREDFKIAVLGGSTSDSLFYGNVPSWVELMYKKYCGNGITIYNAANSGYNSTQEMIKLMRDIVNLHPNMIIVYDGVNDIRDAEDKDVSNVFEFGYMKKIANVASSNMERNYVDTLQLYSGISGEKNAFETWLANIEIMNFVANSIGSKLYAFLQPMLLNKEEMCIHEKSIKVTWENILDGFDVVIDRYTKYAKKFRNDINEVIGKYEYIYNLTDVFDGEDVYFDICHVCKKGNEMIAEKIWKYVKKDIEERI